MQILDHPAFTVINHYFNTKVNFSVFPIIIQSLCSFKWKFINFFWKQYDFLLWYEVFINFKCCCIFIVSLFTHFIFVFIGISCSLITPNIENAKYGQMYHIHDRFSYNFWRLNNYFWKKKKTFSKKILWTFWGHYSCLNN